MNIGDWCIVKTLGIEGRIINITNLGLKTVTVEFENTEQNRKVLHGQEWVMDGWSFIPEDIIPATPLSRLLYL